MTPSASTASAASSVIALPLVLMPGTGANTQSPVTSSSRKGDPSGAIEEDFFVLLSRALRLAELARETADSERPGRRVSPAVFTATTGLTEPNEVADELAEKQRVTLQMRRYKGMSSLFSHFELKRYD
ncbi:unnamed protein product [Protopolystoma xenopodis]|uniref:Uncharacterized protein n=1 Tax=Protopolystoma xenopodis TaxID=117903 RepID=A0A3S5FFV1_9PLAT|nr:unnamed protein product [Protopolystoma xenopodis]